MSKPFFDGIKGLSVLQPFGRTRRRWSPTLGLSVFLSAQLLLLSGCASISKKDCLSGDWQAKGYSDAKKGFSNNMFNEYADTCGKFGVEPNNTAYSAGFQAGLLEFCRTEIGFNYALSGYNYTGICSLQPEHEPAFLTGYIKGIETKIGELEIEYERSKLALSALHFSRRPETLADQKRIEELNSIMNFNLNQQTQYARKRAKWSLVQEQL